MKMIVKTSFASWNMLALSGLLRRKAGTSMASTTVDATMVKRMSQSNGGRDQNEPLSLRTEGDAAMAALRSDTARARSRSSTLSEDRMNRQNRRSQCVRFMKPNERS